jgi:hypothetical protein
MPLLALGHRSPVDYEKDHASAVWGRNQKLSTRRGQLHII